MRKQANLVEDDRMSHIEALVLELTPLEAAALLSLLLYFKKVAKHTPQKNCPADLALFDICEAMQTLGIRRLTTKEAMTGIITK